MSTSDIPKFIYSGSPFLPDLSQETINKIAAKLRLQHEPLQFTVAMEMRESNYRQALQLTSQVAELGRNFGTKPEDIAMYSLGYDAPLVMIIAALLADLLGENDALNRVCQPTTIPQVQKLNEHVRWNISSYRRIFRRDPTCLLIFQNEEENPLFTDVYYRIGLHASRHTYMAYLKILTDERKTEMANKIPFKDAVKATKLMNFAIQIQMLFAGEFPKHYNLEFLALISTDALGPEWNAKGGSSSNELLFYEGNNLVFKGSAADFVPKFAQGYLNRLEREWKAFDLIQKMQQAFVQIRAQMSESLEDYTGDYSDTDLYKIWREHKP